MSTAAPPQAPEAPPPAGVPLLWARLRAWLPYAVVALALVGLGILTAPRPGEGQPLDPNSASPDGARALAEVLRELGAEVRVIEGLPVEGDDTALVLLDTYEDDQREELLAWVRDGGVLVVADPSSPLQPEETDPGPLAFVEPPSAPECDLAAVRDVGEVDLTSSRFHEVTEGAVGCFPREDGAWLVARDEGEGVLVTLGGQSPFLNSELDEADNALLAVALLAPDGDETVAMVRPNPLLGGAGGTPLFALIPMAVRLALLQLLVAFLIYTLWRSRRLGRPVREAASVQVPGSELVVAAGELYRVARSGPHAAQIMRAETTRGLAERLGMPVNATAEQVAAAAAARTGDSVGQVMALLAGPAPADEAGLVALAQSLEQLRRATLGRAQPPTPDRGAVRVR